MIYFNELSTEDQGYLKHLPSHLSEAGMRDNLFVILTDFGFINHKFYLPIRQETITQVLTEQLSVKAVRKLVKETLKEYQGTEKESESLKIANSATKGIQKLSTPLLQKLEANQLEELRTMLTAKLSEISEILEARD
ncbi:hypothetical protein B9S53_03365 [Arthrospira sp. O9.13F]|nr:hypothetical protein B9S53_03365 [Arthrospira sp. O9.13F]